LSPDPLDEPEATFEVPVRRVPKSATQSLEAFQKAYADAPVENLAMTATSG